MSTLRFVVILTFFLLHVPCIRGQQNSFECASNVVHEELLAKNVRYSNSVSQLETEYVSSLSQGSFNRNLEYFVLPIVVHVVHEGGSENISDLQIQEAINNLNDAFRNVGYYNPGTGEDTRISFCLVTRSPSNQSTNGITRSISNLTNLEYETNDALLKDLIRWPSREYINVWVVKDICFYGNCQVAGYSTSPGAHGLPSDGIVIEASYFGSSPALTTSFIHEMGHFLGLAHTFQGGCGNDNCLTSGDRVCDTPPDNATGYFPCNLNYNSCTTDTDDLDPINPFRPVALGGLGDQPDMHQNYMDYGASECFDRFTLGQVERMHFFINHQRKSLAQSLGCFPPCGNLPLANFILSGNEFFVGDVITLSNNSSNYISNVWLINDQVLSIAKDTLISFDSEGAYLITLIVNSSSQGCGSDTFTQEVIITCPTSSIFGYSLSNDSIFLNSNSINSTIVDWSITFNNLEVFTSKELIDTFYFEESGYYQICLLAHGTTCEDIKCEFVRIYKSGTEDCQNGIDDDGDGLIDLFDSDCDCIDSSYQALCPVECLYIPDSFPKISLKLKWKSAQLSDYINYPSNLVCGDIDGDGKIEVVSNTLFGMSLPVPPWGSTVGGIVLLAGSDAHTVNSFNFTPNDVAEGSTIIGLLKDPFSNNSDIIYHNYNSNRIVRYDRYGNKKWESETIGAPYGATINFADFNADGIPELYLNRMIFNAETGKLLALGKEGIGGNKVGFTAQYYAIAHSLAADLLPSPGLELAAGNTVYIVELNNLSDSIGNRMIPIVSNSLKDGLTGLADFDGDQQLDVVLVRSNDWSDGGGVSIWNPRTGSLIATGPAGRGGGIPAIGDLDGDCVPEIIVAFVDQLKIYNFNTSSSLVEQYSFPTKEESGCTSLTLFDFNLDGLMEIVYRDEENLYIIDGPSGVVIDSYPIYSGTFLEGPIIADIDNDGSAEIIVNGSLSGYTDLSVYAFESGGKPWAPARSVWNQYGYHVTNVNDDLSIPKEPQNCAKHIPGTNNCSLQTCDGVYNAFMTQATQRTQEGCIQFPAKDLKVAKLSHDCSPDSLTLCFTVENIGNENLNNEQVFIAAWGSNPFQTSASQLFIKQVDISLSIGEIDTICFSEILILGYDSIFLVANDFGWISPPYLQPSATFDECDYQNNMISIELNLSPLVLDLGPDITKCNSSVISITADSGFQSYLWNDGSTFDILSTTNPGIYFIQATDNCHRLYTDTIQVFVDEPFPINLGPDQLICPEEPLTFSIADSFEWVHWISNSSITCDTCTLVQVSSDSSFNLIAIAGNGNCIVQDTVLIQVIEPITLTINEFTCINEGYEFFGDTIYTQGLYNHLTDDCDSLVVLNLTVGVPSSSSLSGTVCQGDSIEIDGLWFHDEGTFILDLQNTQGCDSVLYFTLTVNPIENLILTNSICTGDSLFFGDVWLYNSGSYSYATISHEGCDSIVHLQLQVENEVIQEEVIDKCEGDSILINNEWINASGLYIDTVQQANCDLILKSLVRFHPHYLTSASYSLCGVDSIWVVDRWLYSKGLYSIDLISSDGCDSIFQIEITEAPQFPSPILVVDCDSSHIELAIEADNGLHVNWSNGDSTLTTTFTNEDTASWVIYYDPECKEEHSLVLPFVPDISVLPVLSDTTISAGAFVRIDLNIDTDLWDIRWSSESELSCDSCKSIFIYPKSNGNVVLELFHRPSGCSHIEIFHIFIEDDERFYLPTIFSPNGDGINDIWSIIIIDQNIEIQSLEIFDRWGNQMGNWKNTNVIEWDGKFKGKELQSGVFPYILQYSISGQSSGFKSGNITLIR